MDRQGVSVLKNSFRQSSSLTGYERSGAFDNNVDGKFLIMIRRIITFFMKHFFDLLYHRMAFLYDLVADLVSLGRWKDWVYTVIPDLQDEPIVEIGHGPGHLQHRMLMNGHSIIGLDESRQMSALAKKRLIGLPNKLIRADARRLPFASASISTITATFPSEYILQHETMAELSRTLSPTGKIVILFAAWPGGSSLPEKTVRLIFRLTGESPPDNIDYSNILNTLKVHNLQAEPTIRQSGNSQLLVVFLRKFPKN
jgi:SAM-dependent methyltransferase